METSSLLVKPTTTLRKKLCSKLLFRFSRVNHFDGNANRFESFQNWIGKQLINSNDKVSEQSINKACSFFSSGVCVSLLHSIHTHKFTRGERVRLNKKITHTHKFNQYSALLHECCSHIDFMRVRCCFFLLVAIKNYKRSEQTFRWFLCDWFRRESDTFSLNRERFGEYFFEGTAGKKTIFIQHRMYNIARIYYPLGILNKPKNTHTHIHTMCMWWEKADRTREKIENDENLWERKLFLIWKFVRALFLRARARHNVRQATEPTIQTRYMQWKSQHSWELNVLKFFGKRFPQESMKFSNHDTFAMAYSKILIFARLTERKSSLAGGQEEYKWKMILLGALHISTIESTPHSHFNRLKYYHEYYMAIYIRRGKP